MKVIIDQDKCIGSGNCVLAVPDVFDQREEDGIVTLLSENPRPELDTAVRRAAAGCPSGAISVQE